MSAHDQTPNLRPLVKRFALPALAAWLLHAGLWWIIVFVLTTPIMSAVSKSINWFLDRFYAGNGRIVETYWMIKYSAAQGAAALIAIALALLLGTCVVRRQKVPPDTKALA